jgi:RHS repeat-associated protein
MIYNAPIIDRTLEPRVTQSLACAPAGSAEVATDPLLWSTVFRPLSDANQANELHGYFSMEPQEIANADHSNQQYSITAVTTSAGAIAERYAYSAYGEATICDASGSVLASSAINNRYTYTCREWDATVGLNHFRARWISPKAGRFVSRDPIGYRGSPFDLYEMLDSRPVDRTDALGLQGGFHGNTICCGGKTIYVGPGGQSCCNEKVYTPERECCEDKTIVAKVKIWNCIVDEGLNLARCWDYSFGWVACPLGWRGRHSYVCLDGPNLGCFSAYKEGFTTGEWEIFDPNNPFGQITGHTTSCKENLTCPATKKGYSTPNPNAGYNFLINNCHQQSGNCGWNWYW